MPGPTSEVGQWPSSPDDASDWPGVAGVDAQHRRVARGHPAAGSASGLPTASGADDHYQVGCQTAEQIERDHPRWMVIYGFHSREYVAFPLFPAPPGTILTAHYAPALMERVERCERYYGRGCRPP
jgi:hypothetical protein